MISRDQGVVKGQGTRSNCHSHDQSPSENPPMISINSFRYEKENESLPPSSPSENNGKKEKGKKAVTFQCDSPQGSQHKVIILNEDENEKEGDDHDYSSQEKENSSSCCTPPPCTPRSRPVVIKTWPPSPSTPSNYVQARCGERENERIRIHQAHQAAMRREAGRPSPTHYFHSPSMYAGILDYGTLSLVMDEPSQDNNYELPNPDVVFYSKREINRVSKSKVTSKPPAPCSSSSSQNVTSPLPAPAASSLSSVPAVSSSETTHKANLSSSRKRGRVSETSEEESDGLIGSSQGKRARNPPSTPKTLPAPSEPLGPEYVTPDNRVLPFRPTNFHDAPTAEQWDVMQARWSVGSLRYSSRLLHKHLEEKKKERALGKISDNTLLTNLYSRKRGCNEMKGKTMDRSKRRASKGKKRAVMEEEEEEEVIEKEEKPIRMITQEQEDMWLNELRKHWTERVGEACMAERARMKKVFGEEAPKVEALWKVPYDRETDLEVANERYIMDERHNRETAEARMGKTLLEWRDIESDWWEELDAEWEAKKEEIRQNGEHIFQTDLTRVWQRVGRNRFVMEHHAYLVLWMEVKARILRITQHLPLLSPERAERASRAIEAGIRNYETHIAYNNETHWLMMQNGRGITEDGKITQYNGLVL